MRYVLLRLACTLHPPSERRARYTSVDLQLYLRPDHGHAPVTAHDMRPLQTLAGDRRKRSFKLSPKFSFADGSSVEAGEIGLEIEHENRYPTLQAYGLGESNPYWRFAPHASTPLIGSQFVYLVAAAPAACRAVRVAVAVTATVQTQLFSINLGTPAAATEHASQRIPL